MKVLPKFLIFLALVAFGQVAWAQTYISDVMVIGGNQSEVDEQWTTLQTQGWTRIDQDLNSGCTAGTPNVIYLLYKTSTNSADAITDFYLSTASNAGSGVPGQITHNGHDYTLTPYAGGTQFTNNKGDLNTGVTGSTDIHLYYTKQPFTIARYITGISFNDFADNGLGADGNNSTGYNLNNNASGYSIYMHLTKQFPDGWIEVFNYSRLDLETHTNNAKILLGANIILLNRVIINGITATIDLNGYTLDRNLTSSGGSDGHVIAIINGASLTLNATGGGTLTAGYADNGGGIWVASGCQLYMNGAHIAGCRANKAGAIYNNGYLEMDNCTISNNIAEDVGGVYNAANATATINNCFFGGNKGNSGCGSIGNATTAISMTISNTTIENSQAGTNGGGIWNGSTLSLTDVIISNCDATRNGGGIYNEGTLTIDGGSITDNSSGILGCGIYTSGTLNMKGNPVVSGNLTAVPSGLQSITYNIYLDNNTKVNVTGAFTTGAHIGVTPSSYANLITSGYSTYNSGVAPSTYFFSDTGTELELKNGEIKIVDFITDLIVGSSSSISDDATMRSTLESYGWTVLPANLNPGDIAIYNTVRMAYKTNNSYGSSGTPITDFYLKTGDDHPATITYEGRTYHLVGVYSGDGCISNYQGDLNSGASDPKIWLYYTKDGWTYGRYFTDIVFTSSQVGGVGANGNYAEGFNLDEGITYYTRYIYMHPTMVVTDPSPIYIWRDRDLRDLLNVDGMTVKLGYDITLISSLHIYAANSNVTLDLNNHNLNLYFSSSAADKGHVLKVYNSCTLNVTGDGILQGGWADYGGGVKVDGGGTVYMNGCTIQNCEATQTGGAIHNAGTFELNNCTLTNNITYNGGAIYNDGTLTVTGTTITGNTAYDHGGAIYNNGGTLHVENCSITSNNAVDVGGIYNKASGTATINGCTLSGNSGSDGCGAIGNSTDAGLMTISNTSITGNTASTNGGGIWNGSSMTLSNVTITGNSCGDSHNGGGIFLRGNSLTMSGNIVVNGNSVANGNLKSTAANNVYLENGKVITVDDAFTEGTTIGITLANTGGVATTGYSTHNAGVDPATYFVSDQFYGIELNNNGEVVLNTAVQVMPANYINVDGTEQTAYTCFKLSTIGSNWGAGWYVVDENVTFDSRITVNGHVHLILADGTTFNATQGIQIEKNDAKSLTIYGQSGQSGQLIAYGADNDAAIGGNYGQLNGVITINGGVIEVHGGAGSAGIGEGSYYGNENHPTENGDLITINRGTINAYGGDGGAGIGGGYTGSGGNIVINGGTVNATGGSYDGGGGSYYCAAGIGGGYLNYVNSSITINGGVIHATGEHSAAGIGQGDGNPNVSKANITLNWTDASAATESIFANKYVGTVTLTQPFITNDGSDIYQQGGSWTNDDLANKTLIPYKASNIIFGTMEHGSMVASQNPAYSTTTITLTSTPDEGYICSSITVTGNLSGREITATRIGTTSDFTFVMPTEDVTVTPLFENTKIVITYIDLNGDEQVVMANKIDDSSFNTNLTAGWWTIEATYLSNRLVIASGAEVNLILRDGITTNASKGINVPQGTSLTIWAQSAGTGKLRGGSSISGHENECHAGIGGNEQEISGTITINGGIIDINAQNSLGAAGIGGGGNYNTNGGYQDTGARGTVIINGGTVTARGGTKGAGIGGGHKRCGTVTINGGTVTGYSEGGSGIGSGLSCASNVIRTVTINGGTVTGSALEPLAGSNIAYGDGIGGDNCTVNINGGTVTATGYYNGSGICGATVSITDAVVTATKGSNNGYGIESTNTTLNYTDQASIITASNYNGTVTLANDFMDIDGNPYTAGVVSDNSTIAGKTLVPVESIILKTAGNWNEPTNWTPEGVPTSEDDVYVLAAATIPADYIAQVNHITLGNGGNITIADGGELITPCAIQATMEKTIAGYNNDGGWNFIATPIAEGTTPSISNGIMAEQPADYDLYYYDEENHYWRNHKVSDNSANPNFDLSNGQGYLYARPSTGVLQFEGIIHVATDHSETIDLDYHATTGDGQSNPLAGWNLVGNPFTYKAYINKPYYKLGAEGFEAVENYMENTIAPCTGVLVKAEEEDETVTFSLEAPAASTGNQGSLRIALSQVVKPAETSVVEPIENSVVEPVETPTYHDNTPATLRRAQGPTLLDNAIVSFNEGNTLSKYYFMEQAANIYIPQGNKDYAIAFSEGQGEMPLNFKAKKNGTYTITVNPENVEMSYLHLIDNMTGADVDLLAERSVVEPVETPTGTGPSMLRLRSATAGSVASYTFNARTTDYESRFKLVFACGDGPSTGSGTFAYISNGNIIVNGEGTLQVVDVMGRIIRTVGLSQCGNHITTAGMTAGVYVLRLIQGDNVKTQKMVIE